MGTRKPFRVGGGGEWGGWRLAGKLGLQLCSFCSLLDPSRSPWPKGALSLSLSSEGSGPALMRSDSGVVSPPPAQGRLGKG